MNNLKMLRWFLFFAALFLTGVIAASLMSTIRHKETDQHLKDALAAVKKNRDAIAKIEESLDSLNKQMGEIRKIAAQSKTRIIEHRTEVVRENSAVDAIPASELESALRSAADEYIKRHPPAEDDH